MITSTTYRGIPGASVTMRDGSQDPPVRRHPGHRAARLTSMMPLRRAAAIAAAAVTLSACASTAAPAAKSTTAAHVLPPGCRSALLVTAAVRSHLETDPGDTHGALRQLNGLEKSLSSGQLQVDTAFAAERLARFQLDATMGQSTAGDAKSFASALSKISRDCRA